MAVNSLSPKGTRRSKPIFSSIPPEAGVGERGLVLITSAGGIWPGNLNISPGSQSISL